MLGHGAHYWNVPPENFKPMTKVGTANRLWPTLPFFSPLLTTTAQAGWYTIFFYDLSLFCSQVSIMLLYIRIWNVPWVRRAAYILLAGVLTYNVFVMVVVLTACVPLHVFWEFELQLSGEFYCHKRSLWWANTYLHVIFDFFIYLLPMPVIFQVSFPKRQKVLLFVLFAFGFL